MYTSANEIIVVEQPNQTKGTLSFFVADYV